VLGLSITSYHLPITSLRVAIREEEEKQWGTSQRLREYCGEESFVLIPDHAKGALISAAYCLEKVESDESVIICAGDSEVVDGISLEIDAFLNSEIEAGSIVFRDTNSRWSFLGTDSSGRVVDVAEKYSLGEYASTGVFFFRRASDLMDAMEWCLVNNLMTDGAYYVSMLLNYFLVQNRLVHFEEIAKTRYQSWAIPEEFDEAT
jgi:hypothetical protein